MACSKQMNELSKMLECPVCMERLTDPRILPCLHTFCEKCLSQHIEVRQEKGVFLCPICNSKYPVPDCAGKDFKRNIFLSAISDLFPDEVDTECDFCKLAGGSQGVPVFLCIDCRDNLCNECAAYHCKSKLTFNHRVVTIKDVKSGQHMREIRRSQTMACPNHEGKYLEIYCKECEIAICYLCKTFEHDRHSVTDLRVAAKNVDDVILSLVETCKEASDKCAIRIQERCLVLKNIGEQKKVCTSNIQKMYAKLKEDVIHEESVAIQQLENEIAIARKKAEAACGEAERQRTALVSTLQYAQDFVNSACDAEKLQQFRDIRSRLESLAKENLGAQVSMPLFEILPKSLDIGDIKVQTVAKNMAVCGHESIFRRLSSYQIALMPELRRGAIALIPELRRGATILGTFETRLQQAGEECEDKHFEIGSECYGISICEGNYVVTDMKNKNVKVFEKNNYLFQFYFPNSCHSNFVPVDVVCQQLQMFISDHSIRGIRKYDNKGNLLATFSGLYRNRGFVTCHGNQLVVADPDGERVLFLDFDCNVKRQLDKHSLGLQVFEPRYVWMADNLDLLVLSQLKTKEILVVDLNQSSVIATIGSGLQSPLGVCFDQFGQILVSDYDKNRIVIFNHGGVHVLTTDVRDPTGICIPEPGQVSVIECYTGKVKIFQYL